MHLCYAPLTNITLVVKNIKAKAKKLIKTVKQLASGTLIDQTFPISLTAANLGIKSEKTIFGSGTPIFKDAGLGLYCVDCGLTGSMHVVGKLKVSVTKGVGFFGPIS